MADIGTFALVIALLTSVYALAAYIIGLQKTKSPCWLVPKEECLRQQFSQQSLQ